MVGAIGNMVGAIGNMVGARGNMVGARGNMVGARGSMVGARGNMVGARGSQWGDSCSACAFGSQWEQVATAVAGQQSMGGRGGNEGAQAQHAQRATFSSGGPVLLLSQSHMSRNRGHSST